MTTKKRNQAGFTLIELALIIAVLGILGAVGAVKLASMTTEANAAAEKTALANARSALAIAMAKDANGQVTALELATYLQGFDAGTSILEGKYKLEYNTDFATVGITTIATGSI